MADRWLRIHEVADEVGLTIRTIRLYQTEGLLPAPRREGRAALYGPEHVGRLGLIADLRQQGFGLAAIKRTLDSGLSPEELRDFARLARQGYKPDPPLAVPAAELQPSGGEPLTSDIAEWAVSTGLYRPRDDGMVDIVCPPLHQAGQDLGRMGVPFPVRRDLADELVAHADAIARAMVETVFEHVLSPLLAPAAGSADSAAAEAALERLRPLAAKAVAGYFPIAMAKAIDALVERELPT